MRIVWGAYKYHATKKYAWQLPTELPIAPGSRLLAQGQDGRYSILYAAKVDEDFQGEPPSGAIIRILSAEETVPEIERQHSKEEFPHHLRREAAAWKRVHLDIDPYIQMGFDDAEKLAELRIALEMHFPVEKYADPTKRLRWIRAARMRQLRELATLAGCLPAGCTPEQTEQILLGLQDGIDVSIYANPTLGWRVMRELRFALADGMDMKPLQKCSRKEIRAARLDYEAAHGLISPEK